MSMRILTSLTCLVLLLLAAPMAGAATTTLYVSPNGNDAWSGALDAPSASDGPLATITGARDALRRLRADGKIDGPVKVVVRGGGYAITQPLVFEPQDSGTADAPATYEAYPNESPAIQGGRVISGWKQEGDRWVADVPEARDGKWPFHSLFVNGERRQIARMPNAAHPWGDYPPDSDFYFTEKPVMEKDANGKDVKSNIKVQYRGEDLKNWDDLDQAVVVMFHSWETSLLRVKNLDPQNHIVEFTGPSPWFFGYWRDSQWYYVEGVLEALDQPGEWCLNHKSGKLYYLPMPGEDMNNATIVAPVASQLVRLEGKPAEGRFVEHLQFRGLRFEFTDRPIEPQGHADSQAASSINAAFETVGARHCLIERCEVGHVANYGVWFRSGSQDNRIALSEIHDLGAGGVRVGETGDAPTENEVAGHNTIDNCFIHEGGLIFQGAVGVWIGHSSYNTLAHCNIADFRYSGISVGWSWGYAPSAANHNTIEFNDVHDIGKGQLNDMGGIYTLGIAPGTVIRNNYFHDIISNPKLYGGWGIYFDEGSSDVLAENNVVCNTTTGGFHQHYGKENRVENNIFALSHTDQIIRSREEEHISFYFNHNIVYLNNGRLLGSNWHNGHFRLDYNDYWDTSGEECLFTGKTLEEWRALGFDTHSVVADPRFVDVAKRDFRLLPDAPALALGFEPIDLSGVGLYGDDAWKALPKQVKRVPAPESKPVQPGPVTENFESTDVGEKPGQASLSEEGAATIRVTDETAASGVRSLKLTDAPGLKYAFNPHLFYSPHFTNGTATAAFSVRLEANATFFHEWRDNHEPYRIGPSLWFHPNGEVKTGDRTLTTVPLGQWIRVEVVCPLGRSANGTYALTITVPGQAPQRFEDLPTGANNFKRFDWCGFVSNGTEAAAIYLDDLSLSTQ
jgi:hypothetical protein